MQVQVLVQVWGETQVTTQPAQPFCQLIRTDQAGLPPCTIPFDAIPRSWHTASQHDVGMAQAQANNRHSPERTALAVAGSVPRAPMWLCESKKPWSAALLAPMAPAAVLSMAVARWRAMPNANPPFFISRLMKDRQSRHYACVVCHCVCAACVGCARVCVRQPGRSIEIGLVGGVVGWCVCV